jgi:adenosylcobinamide-GDP ribazoletransferase
VIASLVLAVRFLTVVPIPGREAEGHGALGRAAWWFPVVGLALGGALVALDRVLGRVFPTFLSAALVLSLWKVATGGIHLDGLSDCLDGLGGRDAQDRLAIMRDPRIGAFGAIGLIIYFLIGLLALAETPADARWRLLLLAPVVGRLAPLLVGPRFAAAAPGHGSGGAFLAAVSGWAGPAYLVPITLLAAHLLGIWGFVVALAAMAVVASWSAFLAWRVGGLTGDVLGAGVELGELTVLLVGAALAHRALI